MASETPVQFYRDNRTGEIYEDASRCAHGCTVISREQAEAARAAAAPPEVMAREDRKKAQTPRNKAMPAPPNKRAAKRRTRG